MRIDAKKERDYAKLAIDYCRIARKRLIKGEDLELPVIRPNTPEWVIWREFFADYFGYIPYAMRRAEHGIGSGSFTIPCEQPEQIAAGYQRRQR